MKRKNNMDKNRIALKNGSFEEVPDSEIKYEFDSPNQFFGVSSNLIPLYNAVSASRAFYGEKFQNQTAALKNGEAPYIQSLEDSSSNTSFQETIGKKLGNVYADDDIEVTKVTPDGIDYKDSKGKTGHKDLYNNFVFNRKSSLKNYPVVKPGDKVKAGSLLAHTNFTDKNGTLAMGINANVGLIPYKGWSLDDATVISEDFAKKLTSQHTYQYTEDASDNVKTSKNHFVSLYPKQYSKDQLNNIDDNGVIKVGSKVEKGTPLILSTKPRMISSKDANLGRLSKYLKGTREDASVVWDHEDEGEVVDVVKGRNGWKVVVDAYSPAKPGDKIVQRPGNKCYVPNTEVFTVDGWKFIKDIGRKDKIASLFEDENNPGKFIAKFENPIALTNYEYNDLIFCAESSDIAYATTRDHRIFTRFPSVEDWKCYDAQVVHNIQGCEFLTGANFDLDSEFTPTTMVLKSKVAKPYKRYEVKSLLAFLPYLMHLEAKVVNYKLHIDFNELPYTSLTGADFEEVLKDLELEHTVDNKCEVFDINIDPRIYEAIYNSDGDIHIPEFIKYLNKGIINTFATTFLMLQESSSPIFVSKPLALDLEHIFILLGYSVKIQNITDDNGDFRYKLILNSKQISSSNIAYHTQPYNGRVYCCQVPGLGVLLTRYQGKIMWNGNCTISKIIPTDKMPRTKEGEPLDILINPLAVPCYSEDTEILTKEKGWIGIKNIDKQYSYMTLNPKSFQMEWQKAEEIHHYPYTGKMYHFSNQQLDWLVTPNHRHFSAKRDSRLSTKLLDLNDPQIAELFDIKSSIEIFGESRQFIKAALWRGNNIDTFTIPADTASNIENYKEAITVSMEDWVQFMARFISDGHTSIKHSVKKGETYIVEICQSTKSNPAKHAKIESLLQKMALHYCKTDNAFIIIHKGLFELLRPLGNAAQKYIPDYILDLSPRYLDLFLNNILLGDSYTTTSKRLIDNLQELCAKLGKAVNIKIKGKTKGTNALRKTCYYANIQKGVPSSWTNRSTKQKQYQTEEWVDYEGFVHCVTVPNGVVFVRRNGKAIFSGNSRVNSALVYELLLGKVAKKTGRTYKLPSFNGKENKWYDFVRSELDKAGLNDTEELYDPVEDKMIQKPVTVGNVYVQKLHHTGESKLSARGQGLYSQNQTPVKGGDEMANSKRLSGLEVASLLSAGAYGVIKDGLSLRGQQNDEYWRKVRMGQTPQLQKKSPFVWDKFQAILQGAGINAQNKGDGILRASPFTDAGLAKLQPTELKNADIVNLKDLKPVDGGLFDPTTTLTNKWSKITLAEPVVNPAFENVVASLLGIKKSDMYDIMQGTKNLEGFGTGTEAMEKALSSINIRDMFNKATDQFKNGPKSQRQKALNRMNYIKGLMRTGLKPQELIIHSVPVLPAAFRPYSIMGDTFIPGDANELYKEVFNTNQAHKELKKELGDNLAKENAINLYNSVKALYGFDEPTSKKLKQRGVSGFMEKLIGGTAKFSFPQRELNSKTVDFSGRSVIGVNPELSMDEVGIPYDIAWKIYSPYIQRELTRRGMSPTDAVEHIEKRSDKAKTALDNVVKTRYVMYSRAPSWHKFNLLGGKAVLHDGKNILLNPLVTSGMNADFDGDCHLAHIIVAVPKNY